MNTNNENKEYELINLKFEYPGMNGGVTWAVISDLSMDELMQKYGKELLKYSPVILLSVEQGRAFKEFHKNESKHLMRNYRTYEFLGYEDSVTEETYFDLMTKYEVNEPAISKDYKFLREMIEELPEVQKRRCKLYFYHGFTEEEIARIEGVDQSNVSRTLAKALENIKKFF